MQHVYLRHQTEGGKKGEKLWKYKNRTFIVKKRKYSYSSLLHNLYVYNVYNARVDGITFV